MPALVLCNGSEIEIYGAGSAVSPINDGVVYSEGTVGALSWTRARREEGTHRWLDKIVKGGEIRRQNGCITIIVQYPRLFNLIIFYRYFIAL